MSRAAVESRKFQRITQVHYNVYLCAAQWVYAHIVMRTAALALSLALSGAVLHAHHNQSVFFDLSRNVRIEGKIVQVFFRNPHSFIQVETSGQDGLIKNPHLWAMELPSKNSLRKRGIIVDSLK